MAFLPRLLYLRHGLVFIPTQLRGSAEAMLLHLTLTEHGHSDLRIARTGNGAGVRLGVSERTQWTGVSERFSLFLLFRFSKRGKHAFSLVLLW